MQAQQLKQEFVATFVRNGETKCGFGYKSCTADKQACVFGISELKDYSVSNIITINGLNLKTVLFTRLELSNEEAKRTGYLATTLLSFSFAALTLISMGGHYGPPIVFLNISGTT